MLSFRTLIARATTLVLFGLVAIFLVSCAAEPTAEDVDRVKEQFLVLRFRAPLVPELRHLGDKELFERSCKNNRVRCERVLEMLKQDDPEFFKSLTGGGS